MLLLWPVTGLIAMTAYGWKPACSLLRNTQYPGSRCEMAPSRALLQWRSSEYLDLMNVCSDNSVIT